MNKMVQTKQRNGINAPKPCAFTFAGILVSEKAGRRISIQSP